MPEFAGGPDEQICDMRIDQAGARLRVCFSQAVPGGFRHFITRSRHDNTEHELAKLAERYSLETFIDNAAKQKIAPEKSSITATTTTRHRKPKP